MNNKPQIKIKMTTAKLKIARQRAASLRMNFNSYVLSLIKSDLHLAEPCEPEPSLERCYRCAMGEN